MTHEPRVSRAALRDAAARSAPSGRPHARRRASRWAAVPLVALIRAYQWLLSPFLGARCRFEPTCSAYALVAIERHGPARGVALAVRRLLRCHPWGAAGYDPVPGTEPKADP
jgi:hypothetical protein